MYRMVIDIWWCNSYIDSKSFAPRKTFLKENFISVERNDNKPLVVCLQKTKPKWKFSDKDMTAQRSFSHNSLWTSNRQQVSFTLEGSHPAPLCQFLISFKEEEISLVFETQHCLPCEENDVYSPPPTPSGLDESAHEQDPQPVDSSGDHGTEGKKKREKEIVKDPLIAAIAQTLCGENSDNSSL